MILKHYTKAFYTALVVGLSLIVGCSGLKSSKKTAFTLIPAANQVGAQALPLDIAPIKAPFPMPQLKRPEFPDRRINIIERKAQENTKITAIIQGAIDDIHQQGGGTVIIPSGKWLTGRISLKSFVNLHLAEGAELYFSGEIEDYLPAVFTRNEGIELMSLGACIYANGQENIAITGKGKLIGPPLDAPLRKRFMNVDVIENVVPLDKPASERVYEGKNGEFIFLPMFISPIHCKNILIEGITLERTPFWNVVPVYCENVIIRGITVNSVGIPRGDGIDIESSRNVLIEYSTLSCGDDCFTMKAGRGEDGLRVNKPTENVVVRFCLAKEGHGGITVGSETAAKINNLYVHDTVFDDTGVGIRFKTRRPRGGGGENYYYERIRMNLRDEAFRWDMLGSPMHVGKLAERLPALPINPLTPSFKNTFAKDIIVENAKAFVRIEGIPETPMQNFNLEHAIINSKKLFTAHDAENIRIKNVKITSEESIIKLINVKNLKFDKVIFHNPKGEIIKEFSDTKTKTIQFIKTKVEK